MDILQFVDRYGLPLVVVALVATFIKRDLWPFVTAQLTRWQDERKAEREAFTATLADLTQIAESGHAARAERDRLLYAQLDAMTTTLTEVLTHTREIWRTVHDQGDAPTK